MLTLFRKAAQRQSKQTTGGSGVYEPTTAPLDEESKGMLKTDQTEMQVRSVLKLKTC